MTAPLTPTQLDELEKTGKDCAAVANIVLVATDDTDGNEWWCPHCGVTVPGSHVTYDETHNKEGCGEPVYTRDDLSFHPPMLRPLAQAVNSLPALISAARECQELQSALSSAQARAEKAESALTRAGAVLAEVEWAGRDMDLEYPCCPHCNGADPDSAYAKEHAWQAGHHEHCALVAARMAIEEARKG